jgi:hypothetical protein
MLDTTGYNLSFDVANAGSHSISVSGSAALGSIIGGGSGSKDGTAGNAVAGQSGDYVLSGQPTVSSVMNSILAKIINLDGTKRYDGNVSFVPSNFGDNGTIAGVGSETVMLTGTGTVASANILNNWQPLNPGTLMLIDGTNGGSGGNYTFTGGTHFGTILNNAMYIPSNIPPKEIEDDPENVRKRRKLQSAKPNKLLVIEDSISMR